MVTKLLVIGHWSSVLVVVLCIAVLNSCSGNSKQEQTPQQRAESEVARQTANAALKPASTFNSADIEAWHKAKDDAFRTETASPLTEFDKERFKGLAYFSPSEKYCVTARFEAFEDPETVIVETTQSDDYRKMKKVGVLRFTIGADSCVLAGYVDKKTLEDMPSEAVLSVYFKDATNGTETYESGRYLELPYKAGAATYTLDFNRAFNPFCIYNRLYSCPLVPPENRLRVRIEAGEKKYIQPK